MSMFCRCGKLATHRVQWNQWVDAVEPVATKRPAYCRDCAREEARQRTIQRHQAEEYERGFDPAQRQVWRVANGRTPQPWDVKMRNAVRRHPDLIVPGGLVKLYKQDGYHYVELWPPKGGPDAWEAHNSLYLLRYLTRLPLVFERVKPEELSTSPTTWRESARRLADTGPVSTTPSTSET